MILTYVCFLPNSIDAPTFADLIEASDLGFEPARLSTDRFGGSRGIAFSGTAVDRLRKLDDVVWVRVEGATGSLELSGIAGWPAQVIIWETPSAPPPGLVEQATRLPGFSAAMMGDADDVFWQSADQINTYEAFGRPWEHLPTVHDEVFDCDKIDVSANPGRRVAVPGMWLWPAAEMWFGPAAFAILDREQLLRCPVGRVEAQPDGVVHVQLFDLDDDIETIRSAQRQFREWLRFDDLIARRDHLFSLYADPRVELHSGDFDHGGVRRLIEWLDGEQLAPRSRATRRRTTELDISGAVIWQEIVPIS